MADTTRKTDDQTAPSKVPQSPVPEPATAPAIKPSDFEDVEAKEIGFGETLLRLFRILWRSDLKKWRGLLLLALFLTVLAKVFSVAAPVLLGDGINSIGTDQSLFVTLVLGYGAARFLSLGLPQLRDAFFVRITQDAMRIIAVEAFGHTQRLGLRFHLTKRTGALNRIIERGSNSIDFLIRFLAFNIAPTLIELALAASVLWTRYGWEMAAVAVSTVAAYAVLTIWLTEVRTRQRRVVNKQDTELKARSSDIMTNFEVVKAFGTEARETRNYDTAIKNFSESFIPLSRSLSALNAGQEFIMNAGLLGVALFAGFAAAGGGLQAGDVTAVVLILLNIYRPLNILGFAWREIKQGMVDMEKLFGLLAMEPEVRDKPEASPLANASGDIVFDDVSFVHEGRTDGIHNFTAHLKGGSFIGIVGPSGAGKSTILKLLFRFFDPQSGTIRVGGEDLRDVTQQSLRQSLGLVPQEVVLFNDTLRYNLAYGVESATDQQILEAADKARLTDFLKRLPEGLDTRVGERGLKLSGGEKQRVGVARVILKQPQILILDEATSALDSATEKEVQLALNAAAEGRTTLAVAHRLSTLRDADTILVLKDGKLVEAGPPATLLESDSLFKSMWERQLTVG